MTQKISAVLVITDPRHALPSDRVNLARMLRQLLRERLPEIDVTVISSGSDDPRKP